MTRLTSKIYHNGVSKMDVKIDDEVMVLIDDFTREGVPRGFIGKVYCVSKSGRIEITKNGDDSYFWVLERGMYKLVTEAPDDTPKTWTEMTDAEKGALLLAEYEGEAIQEFTGTTWKEAYLPEWMDGVAYRVHPWLPKRETVSCWWNGYNIHRSNNQDRTHRITFYLIDGEPDLTSIRMDRIE